jgi:hypothetical protein
VLAGLAEALTTLSGTDPQAWDDATVADAMAAMVRLGSHLDVVTSQIADVWNARRLWADDGSRSARARLGRYTNEDPLRLGVILWRATRLRTMPLAADAWRAGEIGTDRVDVLCRANTPARAADYADNEELLVWIATALDDFAEYARMIRRWCDAADQGGADPDPERRANKQRNSRHFDLGEGLDGVKFFTGRLDAIDGEIFTRELHGVERRSGSDRRVRAA